MTTWTDKALEWRRKVAELLEENEQLRRKVAELSEENERLRRPDYGVLEDPEVGVIKDQLLRLADACIMRKVGQQWPAIEIYARHLIEKYGDPRTNLAVLDEGNDPSLAPVLLKLAELRDDFDQIGAGGWKARVVEIINLATGVKDS